MFVIAPPECDESRLSGSSTGTVTTSSPTGADRPYTGSWLPGDGLFTSAGSYATVTDREAQSTLSVAPNSSITSNFLGWLVGGDYQTPPQLVTCESSPSRCDNVSGQAISTVASKALQDVLHGKKEMAWYRIGNGIVDIETNFEKAARRVPCIVAPEVLACDPPASNAEVTAHRSGTQIQVVSGSWVVLNLVSGQSVLIPAGHGIFVPGNPNLAAKQDMSSSVHPFDLASLHRWWAKPTATTASSSASYALLGVVGGAAAVLLALVGGIRRRRRRALRAGR